MLELSDLLWDKEGKENPKDRFLKLVVLKTLALAPYLATPIKRPLCFLHSYSTTMTLPLGGHSPFDFNAQRLMYKHTPRN